MGKFTFPFNIADEAKGFDAEVNAIKLGLLPFISPIEKVSLLCIQHEKQKQTPSPENKGRNQAWHSGRRAACSNACS